MVPLTALWLPIILSAVFVFIASNILWVVLPFWHAKDYKRIPNDAPFVDATKPLASGQYIYPWMDWKTMTPEQKQAASDGPAGFLIVRNPNKFSFPGALIQYLLYTIVVSLFVAYLTGRVLGAGAPYLEVHRVAGTAGMLAWAFGTNVADSIWYGRPWSATIKHVIDGVIFGFLIGGTFGWLWPG
ncbi:MAG TPA: hypothetical protein VEU30_09205 [Thermoanaerobaculia bacterium]|nr:hypothetical protein [Thermoanaerobaculia bacterium]